MSDGFDRFNSWKVLIYADRIEEIVKGNMPAPVVLHIYPTNTCSNNCAFCIMKDERSRYKGHLQKHTLFKTLDDAQKYDIKLIHLSGGGEPLLHPDINEYLQRSKRYPARIALSTNGQFLRPEHCENIHHIRISLNCSEADMYQQITGNDCFDRVLSNVESLLKYRNEKSIACDVGLGFVVTPQNWRQIYKFCWYGMKLGVDFVHVRPAYLNDDAELMQLMPQIVTLGNQAERDFQKFLQVFVIKEKFDGYWTPREYSRCRSTPLMAVLGADATFRICQDVLIPSFGDYNEQSFEEIWQSEDHKKVIDGINLDRCPRCVENKMNEIIEKVFVENRIRKELL